MERINRAVRQIVDFMLREGDIESRRIDPDVMARGVKAHRAIASDRGGDYRSEATLLCEFEAGGFLFELNGKADGILTEDGAACVEEVKATSRPLDAVGEGSGAHWGQAKCYAYMLALRDGLENVKIRLVYIQMDTEERTDLEKVFSFLELESFLRGLLEDYAVWVKLEIDHALRRDAGAAALTFPHGSFRKGQREMCVEVFRAIRDSKRAYICAPTGIGKTVAALFPAVKALGGKGISKIFYLTAKGTTSEAASSAADLIASCGVELWHVCLTAKDKICPMEERDCRAQACNRAAGHYDRVNAALLDMLTSTGSFSREAVARYAENHTVCPFELALDLSLFADAVICDYNYVFDPFVYLRRYFMFPGGSYAFLIDEAHNLPPRVAEMYSCELVKSDFTSLYRELKKWPVLRKAARAISLLLGERRKRCGEDGFFESVNFDSEMAAAVDEFIKECGPILAEDNGEPPFEALFDVYFKSRRYAAIGEFYDECYTTLAYAAGRDVHYKLMCIDPSARIGERLEMCRGAAIFSATLLPMSYYVRLMDGRDDDGRLLLGSPFDPSNLLVAVDDGISLKYADREASCPKVAALIEAFVTAKAGNYMVFFPSYEYMERVRKYMAENYPSLNIVCQEGAMGEEDRKKFLELFEEGRGTTAFCVLGGIFSEGIDLVGDRLIGAVVVGVGLPRISHERNIMRAYYDEVLGTGYAYAYVYPGMNKVLQAVGRVIRGHGDRGAVLLIDRRYATHEYRRLFPSHLRRQRRVRSCGELREALDEFWAAPRGGS